MNVLNTTDGGGGLVAKSCLTLMTPWTVACQAPLSKGFSRQEYWSRLPCPPPEDLSDPGIKPISLTSSALAGGSFKTSTALEALKMIGNAYQKHEKWTHHLSLKFHFKASFL